MQGMAAILQRLWPALLSAALLVGAGCSLIRSEQPPAVSNDQHAQRLAADGKHADAARAYADLAAQNPSDRDNYQLLSAEQWVLAGDLASAKQAYAAVSPEARTALPTSRALVAAEIDVAQRDGAAAIRELDSIPVPTAADLAQNYWWLRGKAAFLSGHPVEGTRAFVERERYLPDPAGLRASRLELFGLIREAASRGASLKAPPEERSHRRRMAGLGAGGARDGAQSHARGSGIGGVEARLSAASRKRQPCSCPRRIRSRWPPASPTRSPCCCRSPGAPSRSESRFATASSPPICSRIPPRVRI